MSITKEDIKKELKSIIEELKLTNINYETRAQSVIDNLVVKIVCQEDSLELLAYLCYKLMDCKNYVESNRVKYIFQTIADEIISSNRSVINFLQTYMTPSNQLLDLLTMVPAPSLKERVKIANLSLDDKYLDPITTAVMDYPVTYTVCNVSHTVDFNTLMNSNLEVFSLTCPFSRESILLETLQPRLDLVNEIIDLCNAAAAPMNEQEAIKNACILAKNGDIEGLKEWRIANPYLDCSTSYKDPENKLCTPLHMACAANQFYAAVWLLEQGALPDIKNAAQKTPLEYLKLNRLELEIDLESQDNGLRLLLALYNLYVAKNEIDYEIDISSINSTYVPALYWHGVYLCTHNRHGSRDLNHGLEKLAAAVKNNFYLAADRIIKILKQFEVALILNQGFIAPAILSKIAYYVEIATSVLSTDSAVFNRGEIEILFSSGIMETYKQHKCNNVQLIHAYAIAHLAQTRVSNKLKLDIMQISLNSAILNNNIKSLDAWFAHGVKFELGHIIIAINTKQYDVLKWLVERKIDINKKIVINYDTGVEHSNILIEMMKHNLYKEFELLLPLADTYNVISAVENAIINGKSSFVDIILNNRSDIHVNHISVTLEQSWKGSHEVRRTIIPALIFASIKKDHELMKVLLKHNALVDIRDSYGQTALFSLISHNVKDVIPTVDILINAGANIQNSLIAAVKNNNIDLVTHILNNDRGDIINLEVLNLAIELATADDVSTDGKNIISKLKDNRNKCYVYNIFKLKHIPVQRYMYKKPTFVNKSIGFIFDFFSMVLDTTKYIYNLTLGVIGCIINCYNVAIVFHSLICLLAPKALLAIAAVSPLLFYLSFCLFVKVVYNFRACVNAEAECFRFLLEVMPIAFNNTISLLNSNVIKPICNFIYNKMLIPIYEFFHGPMHKKITADSDNAQTNEAHTSGADAPKNNYNCFTKCKSLLFGGFFSSGSSSEPPRQIEHTDDLEANLIRTRSYSRVSL